MSVVNYKISHIKFLNNPKKSKRKAFYLVIVVLITLTILSIVAMMSLETANTLSNLPVIGSIEGNWKFEDISVKRQDYMLNCKVITPMINKSIEKNNITIEKMVISDLAIKITAIESNVHLDAFYQYQLMDNYGNVLNRLSKIGYDREGTREVEITFEPLHNNPQYFVISVLDKEV